ncbi:MAG: hypothetical protein C6H99_00720, partial [Epsilonproteobacteria bacterium]|nr:hypothetical protein [Campylobacterota bacterium]NPA64633.1 hypothetical protein [Campylobacterota bacterium]
MKLKVLTTSRQIRQYLQNQPQGMVDKVLSIGEFFSKAVVVEGKRKIDGDLKKIYLYRALEQIDVSKLGLSRDFLRFFKNSDLVFDFWSELAKEKVTIEQLYAADTYTEYEEHLRVLSDLLENYQKLLAGDGFYDEIAWEEWEINEAFFEQIEMVELELEGYLSQLEREVLDRVPVDVVISFEVSRYNRPLIGKMFGDLADGLYRYDYHQRAVRAYEPLPGLGEVETASFEERIWQVQYALASIQEFYDAGMDPDRMAIVLPDESMSEYLRLFNNGNLNFAMGEPFERSRIYTILQALYDYMAQGDLVAFEKIKDLWPLYQKSDLLEFIRAHASPRELTLLDEELHKIEKLFHYIDEADGVKRLHFVLERLRKLSFDDIQGGRVTVMGVLESRGVEFDGVVVLDFNEEIVPNVQKGDMFLNSAVRQRAGLPTRKERESLQKHYYHRLLQNAKKVRIAYVHNEEQSPSRFLYELGLVEGSSLKERYKEVLFRFGPDPQGLCIDGIAFDPPKKLYPTTLQILKECPKRYYLEYILQLKNDIEEEEFNFGLAFHEAMESLLVTRPTFASSGQYFDAVMEQLLAGRSKEERYIIQSQWEDRVAWFCEQDFPRLARAYRVERFLYPKELGGYRLLAKFDRMDDEAVIDYKSGSPKEADDLQALFYQYIFDKKPLFYYLKDQKIVDKSVPDPKTKLQEILDGLCFETKEAEDERVCRWGRVS